MRAAGIVAGLGALLAGAWAVTRAGPAPASGLPTVTVYKSPTCGCCAKWVDYMRAEGFTVEAHDLNDMSGVKERYGITYVLQSCHTAVVGDYVLEGHVPADLVRRLLAERPAIRGLAVPGMPAGVPGMDGTGPYDVLSFTRGGDVQLYERR